MPVWLTIVFASLLALDDADDEEDEDEKDDDADEDDHPGTQDETTVSQRTYTQL